MLDMHGFMIFFEALKLPLLRDNVPDDALQFFQAGYPDMRTADENRAVAEGAGYNVLETHTLPRETGVEGYYDVTSSPLQVTGSSAAYL